jgi:hypothetical protein
MDPDQYAPLISSGADVLDLFREVGGWPTDPGRDMD